METNTYDNIDALNRMIERREDCINSCEYVVNYYLSQGLKIPGNVKAMDALYKDLVSEGENTEFLYHLGNSKSYFRSVTVKTYLETR